MSYEVVLRQLCGQLIDAGNNQVIPEVDVMTIDRSSSSSSSSSSSDGAAQADDAYNRAALSLVKLKSLNRKIHLSLDAKRRDVEAQKDRVDRLQLKLENMLYKRAYLHREIRSCKDLTTPYLTSIEEETQMPLAVLEFSDSLPAKHQRALNLLKEEMKTRIDAKSSLEDRKKLHQEQLDVLDIKRKFLEELPANMGKIETVATAMQAQFEQQAFTQL